MAAEKPVECDAGCRKRGKCCFERTMSEATTRERSQEHGLCAEERKSATGNRISSKGLFA